MKRCISLYRLVSMAVCMLLACAMPACQHPAPSPAERVGAFRTEIAPHLGQLGARNWIVVADAACPVLAGQGVDVVAVPLEAIEVFREVLDMLELQGALTPRVWVSNELEAVPEKHAPGMRQYRRELHKLLGGRFHYRVDNRFIDMQLAQAASAYRILYIKTASHLPYGSIAIELDSGYWDSAAEEDVRSRMQQLVPKAPTRPAQAVPLPSSATHNHASS